MGGLATFYHIQKTKKQPVRSKIVYIAHPIGGNVAENLARIRKIVKFINTSPKHTAVVPFVPYYVDVVSLNDDVPEERLRGLKNGQEILSRKGMIDEIWMCGPALTEGMRQELLVALNAGIKVVSHHPINEPVNQAIEEWNSSR